MQPDDGHARVWRMSKALRLGLAGVTIAAASYLAMAAVTWIRFGAKRRDLRDALLERFMPEYDVIEHHEVLIDAPAGTTFRAACEMDLQQSRVIRTIFRTREAVLRAKVMEQPETTFLEQMKAIGWGVLAEIPDREIVLGAATKPWMANPVFEPIPAEEFLAFSQPDYVKIAWTIRADSVEENTSVFRTQTRAIATDANARSKFRLYWSLVSPGVNLIRWMSLGLVRADAERRAEPRSKTPDLA